MGEIGSMEAYYFDGSIQTNQAYEEIGNDLSITLDEVIYDFDLNKGVNFHFLIIDSRTESRHVAKG